MSEDQVNMNSEALEVPVKLNPPKPPRAGTRDGIYSRPAGTSDLDNAMIPLLEDRGSWYKIAANVPNYGRYYDGMRKRGCMVSINQVEKVMIDGEEKPLFDIYCMLPEGEIKGRGSKAEAAEAKRVARALETSGAAETEEEDELEAIEEVHEVQS